MADVSIIEFSSDIATAEAPPPLPIGEYPATVESVTTAISNTSGKEYLAINVRISPDDFPADFDGESYPDGVLMNYNRLTTSDDARNKYRMRKWCEAIGASMGKQVDPNDWVGMSLRVGVVHRKWEEEDRPNIGKISSL